MIYDVEFNSSTQYPAPSVVELAVLAEARGFAAFWEGEANNMDPMVLLSAIAARTRTLQLGTAIYHVFGRSPVTLGIQAATLNDLSGGRFLLGLGPSNPRIASWHGAVFDRPIRRMREYIAIVQAVERGEKVEYHGETYATNGFRLSWRPRYPASPLYLAALGPQMLRLAGQIARGVIVNMADPPQLRRLIAAIRDGAAAAGRNPAEVEIVAKVRCALNPDREAAKAPLRKVLTFYSLADFYRRMLADMGWGPEIEAIYAAYQRGGFNAGMAQVTDRMLAELPLVAATSVDEIRDRVRPYEEAGATRIILAPVPCTPDVVPEIKAFVEAW
ncbi:MAG TPA: LLM class flavin-dependent oxidoreductase [Chloroflexota bacterium]|nr:LLM class flavin-dependent oxidoreductase [Chloroflexota bacterium]